MNINNELSLLNKKNVYSFTRFTSLDYPDKLACVVWFTSCNMRCLYCYNDNIVQTKEGIFTPLEILDFLKTRVGLLDGVVLSGGEASLHALKMLCEKIKEMGFDIKLDTNGSNPKLLQELIKENLIDMIALDFKAPQSKFKQVTKSNLYNEFIESLEYLIKVDFNFEVRTTVHADLINLDDLNSMISLLKNKGYKNTYYLQNFLETSSNLGNIKESKNIIEASNILSQGLSICWRN